MATQGHLLAITPYHKGSVQIFDAQGQLLYHAQATPHSLLEVPLLQGVYFIRFNNQVLEVSL